MTHWVGEAGELRAFVDQYGALNLQTYVRLHLILLGRCGRGGVTAAADAAHTVCYLYEGSRTIRTVGIAAATFVSFTFVLGLAYGGSLGYTIVGGVAVVFWLYEAAQLYRQRRAYRHCKAFYLAVLDAAVGPTAASFDPAWRTAAVLGLAERAELADDFTALRVLEDALRDAGCADDRVLRHCRGALARGSGLAAVVLMI